MNPSNTRRERERERERDGGGFKGRVEGDVYAVASTAVLPPLPLPLTTTSLIMFRFTSEIGNTGGTGKDFIIAPFEIETIKKMRKKNTGCAGISRGKCFLKI